MKYYLDLFFTKIPEKYRDEFLREILRNNYTKLSFISIFLLITELLLLLFKDYLLGTETVVAGFTIYNLILIPVILYYHRKINAASLVRLQILQFFYALFAICFGIGLTFISQAEADLVHMYFMVVFAVAFILYFPAVQISVLLIFTMTIFLCHFPIFQTQKEISFIVCVNAVIVNLISLVLSRTLHQMRLLLFLDRKQINEQNEKLEMLVRMDSMTGLYNHEAALQILSEVIEKSSKETPLSLIIADIDDFKQVNDRHGHLIGDRVIKDVAEAITRAAKPNGIVCRYGGEEFMIVLPETDLAAASQTAEKIRQALSDNHNEYRIAITLSGGVSQFGGETMNEFIHRTDNKLYQAKREGKNRFLSA